MYRIKPQQAGPLLEVVTLALANDYRAQARTATVVGTVAQQSRQQSADATETVQNDIFLRSALITFFVVTDHGRGQFFGEKILGIYFLGQAPILDVELADIDVRPLDRQIADELKDLNGAYRGQVMFHDSMDFVVRFQDFVDVALHEQLAEQRDFHRTLAIKLTDDGNHSLGRALAVIPVIKNEVINCVCHVQFPVRMAGILCEISCWSDSDLRCFVSAFGR